MRQITVAAIVLLCLPVVARGQEQLAPIVRQIVADGESVIGAEPDESFRLLADVAQLGVSDVGTTVVAGRFVSSSGTRRTWVEVGLGGAFSTLTTGDALPQTGEIPLSEGLTITHGAWGIVNADGDLVFLVGTEVDGEPRNAVVTRNSGVLQTQLCESFPAPLLPLIDVAPEPTGMAMNGDTFVGSVVVQTGTANGRSLVRRRRFGRAELVVRQGDTLPGLGVEVGAVFEDIAVSDGGRALAVTYLGTGRWALLLAGAGTGSQVQILQQQGSAVPGTDLFAARFGHPTFGPGPSGGVRHAWVAAAAEDPLVDEAQLDHAFLFDAAQGVAPLLGTGTSIGEHTIVSRNVGELSVALADAGRVVAVASISGPGLFGSRQGVIRFDPIAEPPLTMVLHEGGAAPPGSGGPRTIQEIHQVSVAQDGRIGAEVAFSDGELGLLVENLARSGDFVVAAATGTVVETENGPREIVSLSNGTGEFPELSGPGRDGRRSRFSAAGELVFFAFARTPGDSLPRTGVYGVRLGQARNPCDVTVRKRGSKLDIRGGRDGCHVIVDVDRSRRVHVRPGPSTTVNGSREPSSFLGVASLLVRMSSGADTVEIRNAAGEPTAELAGNVKLDMGPGGDTVSIAGGVAIGRSLTIHPGKLAGFEERIVLRSVSVAGRLRLVGNAARTSSELVNVDVGGAASLTAGGNGSDLSLGGCHLRGRTKLLGGRDSERVRVNDTWFAGRTLVDSKRGIADEVELVSCVAVAGGVGVRTKRSLGTVVRVEQTEVRAGDLRIDTGRDSAEVDVVGLDVARDISVRTAGSGATRENVIRVSGARVGRHVKVLGKGNAIVSVDDGTTVGGDISMRLKSAARHDVTLDDCVLASGGVRIESKADRSTVRLSGATIPSLARITTGSGDDLIEILGSELGAGARVNGRSGADELVMDSASRDASGPVVVRAIETESSPEP